MLDEKGKWFKIKINIYKISLINFFLMSEAILRRSMRFSFYLLIYLQKIIATRQIISKPCLLLHLYKSIAFRCVKSSALNYKEFFNQRKFQIDLNTLSFFAIKRSYLVSSFSLSPVLKSLVFPVFFSLVIRNTRSIRKDYE